MEELIIGAFGVVLGALLTVAKESWTERRTRNKRAQYLAVRVIYLLDEFISGCIEVAHDDGEHHGRDASGCTVLTTKLPTLDLNALDDVDWQSLPIDLMYSLLNFPSHINQANGVITDAFEYEAIPPDFEEGVIERQLQYSMLGIKAYDLDAQLRKTCNIPNRVSISGKRNAIDVLTSKREENERYKQKRYSSN